MKITAQLDAPGIGDAKDALQAKGFELTVGEYNDPMRATIKMDFAQGISLLNDLVAAAAKHHDAVETRLAETAALASFGKDGS